MLCISLRWFHSYKQRISTYIIMVTQCTVLAISFQNKKKRCTAIHSVGQVSQQQARRLVHQITTFFHSLFSHTCETLKCYNTSTWTKNSAIKCAQFNGNYFIPYKISNSMKIKHFHHHVWCHLKNTFAAVILSES